MVRALIGIALLGLGIVCTVAKPAMADEQMTPLAISGDWAAMAHRESITSPADMCLALNPVQNVAFRADENGIELRVIDQKWSLPPDVKGDVVVKVGTWSATLSVSSNTDTMISADVPTDSLIQMFAAMDKASAMTIAVGKGKPRTVSLVGSSKATNAFRTCAGIPSNDHKAGDNPFQ